MKLRIGIETECLTRPFTGIGYYTLSLIESLKRLDHKPLCFHTKDPAHHLISGIHHFLFKKPLKCPFYHSLAALFRLRCFDQVDLLFFPYPKIHYLKKPSVPFILTIHDLMPLLFPHFFPKKTHWMMKFFLSKYLKDAAKIITISETTKRDLLRLFTLPEEKIIVIPVACLHPPSQVVEEKKPYILYVGSFEPRKNLPGILEAFSRIKKERYPYYQLIIVGKEDRDNKFPFYLIKSFGLSQEDLIFIDSISEEKKISLFKNASLFLWPSFYEGFGIPLLEAMHFGAPIVTTNFGAPKEIVGDAALLVDPKNPHEIARASIKILSSQTESRKLILKGLKRSQTFSLEKTTSLYSNLLRCFF